MSLSTFAFTILILFIITFTIYLILFVITFTMDFFSFSSPFSLLIFSHSLSPSLLIVSSDGHIRPHLRPLRPFPAQPLPAPPAPPAECFGSERWGDGRGMASSAQMSEAAAQRVDRARILRRRKNLFDRLMKS